MILNKIEKLCILLVLV